MKQPRVPERDARAQANLGNLLRVIYDGRKAIACQYGHEEVADRESAPDPELDLLELSPSES